MKGTLHTIKFALMMGRSWDGRLDISYMKDLAATESKIAVASWERYAGAGSQYGGSPRPEKQERLSPLLLPPPPLALRDPAILQLNNVFSGSNDTWVGKMKDAMVSGKLICDVLAQAKIDPWEFNYHSHKDERIELHEMYSHLGQSLNNPPRPSRASFKLPPMIIDKNELKYLQLMPMTA